MLRKSIKINSGGPKAKKDYVVNIDVFLLPKKRRKLLLLPSSPSLVQGVTCYRESPVSLYQSPKL